MIIDYLGHSGFLVETKDALLLFDYYRGDAKALLSSKPDKPLFVFVSHAHADHFNPDIFSLAGNGSEIKYILSFDLKKKAIPKDADVLYLEADKTYDIHGFGTVQTLISTDEGLAFFADTGSETVFHAGDLHWWDWEGEDAEWLKEQERLFKQEINKLADKRIDAAFAVLDDRLEKNEAKGLEWLLKICRPANLFPMHFTNPQVIKRFIKLNGELISGVEFHDTGVSTHWEI